MPTEVNAVTRLNCCLMLALLVVVLAPISTCHAQNDDSVRACGTKLTKMIVGLCNGCIVGSNLEPVEKRHRIGELLRKRSFIHAQSTNSTGTQVNVERRGVTDECCFRTCSISYLKRYCCPERQQ